MPRQQILIFVDFSTKDTAQEGLPQIKGPSLSPLVETKEKPVENPHGAESGEELDGSMSQRWGEDTFL